MQCIKKITKVIKSEPIDCEVIHITSDHLNHHQEQQLSTSSSSSQESYSLIAQKESIIQQQPHYYHHQQHLENNQKIILSPRVEYHNKNNHSHATTILNKQPITNIKSGRDVGYQLGNDLENHRHCSRSSSISPSLISFQQHQQTSVNTNRDNSPQIIITRSSGMPPSTVLSSSQQSQTLSGGNSTNRQNHHQQQQVRVIRDGRFYDETRKNLISSHSSPPSHLVTTSSSANYDEGETQHNLSDLKISYPLPLSQISATVVANDENIQNQPMATTAGISRKYIVSRHINVISSNKLDVCSDSMKNTLIYEPPTSSIASNSIISESGSRSSSTALSSSPSAQVFRTPIVSSSSGNSSVVSNNINNCRSIANNVNSGSSSMRPPPPPPPPKVKQITTVQVTTPVNEEPSSSIPDLEFDGTTVLCRVCGDKASGFHYGVHSCEGCKGFFRRSIQQKIQYRPCTKNQQCSILRINRNRCQYCRLKKCIAVGMSRDAVRFGRVPKREKARILAAMQQSTQNRGQQRALATELDDPPKLLEAVLRAHMETCEFTKEKVTAMRQRARECPSYSMPTLLACPLNPAPELQSEQEFSQRFAHVIRGVIDFAGMIPGFQYLTQDDKFTLLKAGLFDALFVRLICMFDSSINSIICLNGQVMRRDAIQNGANARFLVDSTFNFAERMNSMNLTDTEIGLFCAIVLITPDRPGLRNIELIEKMYTSLKGCLQQVILRNRPDQPEFMSELLKTLPDLRTLSTLHTEKLVVFRTEHKEMLRQQMWSMEDDQPSKSPGSNTWDANGMEDVAKSPLGSVSSTESGDLEYSQSSLVSSAPLLAATLSGSCPLRHRANSGSSAEDVDIVGSHAHLTQNGLTITPVVKPHAHLNNRYRKLDSPTDSGIESGNEKAESTKTVSSGGSSSCSSPRSSVDDILDEHAVTANHAQNSNQIGNKRQIIEDMPVLKRVLQAPPLYDTNSLMDEAYKPHKKFRALRHREFETAEADANISQTQRFNTPTHPVQSQLHMHLTRNTPINIRETSNNINKERESSLNQTQHSSLSSTHSVLAKSLMEEPRMTPEQMKRTDIIQNYIMREQSNNNLLVCATSPNHQQCPYSNSPASSSTSSNSNCSSPSTTTVTLASPPPPLPHTMRWQGHSVITTTALRQHTNSPGVAVSNSNNNSYFQSPHSTSVSPPRPPPSSQSPQLLELQVDIADSQQPLNLSKKSPTPPPIVMQQTTKLLARQYPVATDVTVTPTTSPAGATTSQVHKVLLEA